MQIRNSGTTTELPAPARLTAHSVDLESLLVIPLTDLPPAALEHVAHYFRTLSEPMRLRILNTLGTGELSVGDIAAQVDSSVANVSRHLAQMAQHGLVARANQGNSVLYRIVDPTVHELCDLVCGSIARRLDQQAGERAAFQAKPAARVPARKRTTARAPSGPR